MADDHTTIVALIGIIATIAGGMVWTIKLLVRQLVRAVNSFQAFETEEKATHARIEQSQLYLLDQHRRQTQILEQMADALNKLSNGGLKIHEPTTD